MPTKEYRIWLSDTAYIIVELVMRMDAVLNRAVDDFKTHYESYIRNYLQN